MRVNLWEGLSFWQPLFFKKLSKKVFSALYLLSKCSFTISKLRFLELRKP